MGCDIHLCVEILKKGKWKAILGDDLYSSNTSDKKPKTLYWLYDIRDYNLFALLADVRNIFYRIIPISESRGVPYDVSKEVKAEIKRWENLNGHSHSYFTLRELLECDYNQTVVYDGGIKFTVAERSIFFSECIPKLEKLGKPDEVRIVFWFDD